MKNPNYIFLSYIVVFELTLIGIFWLGGYNFNSRGQIAVLFALLSIMAFLLAAVATAEYIKSTKYNSE